MVSFGPATFFLVFFITGSRTSSSSPGNITSISVSERTPRVDNNKQATIWLSSTDNPIVPTRFYCTGTIITRQHVLTASVCVDRLDEDDILVSKAKDHLSASREFSRVVAIISNSQYDMAVLQVRESFFPALHVIKLLENHIHIATDDKCTVSGWLPGSEMWQYEGVLYLTHEDCSAVYSELATPVSKIHVCSTPEMGNATCTMGLGWSLVCDEQLTGIFTWTHFSCEKPSVYASVEAAIPWIMSFSGASHLTVSSFLFSLVVTLTWSNI